MNKLVCLKATFPSMEYYLNHHPVGAIDFYYLDDGKPLSKQDQAKVEKITAYYLEHDIYPVFLLEDNESVPLIGEATIDLCQWTKEGLPMFKMRDLTTGKKLDAPTLQSQAKNDEARHR